MKGSKMVNNTAAVKNVCGGGVVVRAVDYWMAGTVGGTPSGWDGVKGGGIRGPTHDVSGLLGLVRNDARTVWAHGE
jgi:hypothetical protein